MLKYPGIKKNAAIAFTHVCPNSVYTLQVTCPGCSSFLKNLHSSLHAHAILRLTHTATVLQCVHGSTYMDSTVQCMAKTGLLWTLPAHSECSDIPAVLASHTDSADSV
jgi:hypothetical protein